MNSTSVETKVGPAIIRWTNRFDGDFSKESTGVKERREEFLNGSWTWLNQTHGKIVVVEHVAGEQAGVEADGVITSDPNSILAIQTADCASVALIGDNGTFGAIHAGWRGVKQQIISVAAQELRKMGAKEVFGALGPCIHAECYEFGSDECQELSEQFGPWVQSQTKDAKPAIDLQQAIYSACGQADVEFVFDADICTSCDENYFSHRARGEKERFAMVVATR